MALRITNVTSPAAGHDWSFTVPGQWFPYLYGVTAVLNTTGGTLTSVPDESGNGRNAAVVAPTDFTIGNVGPWPGGADNYSVFHSNNFGTSNTPYAIATVNAAFGGPTVTVEGWFNMNAGTPAFGADMFSWYPGGGANDDLGLAVKNNSLDPYTVRVRIAGTVVYEVPNFASRGAWHHVAMSYDNPSTTIKLYVDGALVNTGVNAVTINAAEQARAGGGQGAFAGFASGTAAYNVVLTQPQIAAHAAANGSWAAYKTAVLANAPSGLWNIGKPAVGSSRIVTLKVTNGSVTVAQFPANFASATANSFTWSWQVLGPAAQSSTDGVTNSVPIPELAVPAGYVISSSTLDLGGTDQWGPITIWFDDGTGPTGGGGGGDLTYRNTLLLPAGI